MKHPFHLSRCSPCLCRVILSLSAARVKTENIAFSHTLCCDTGLHTGVHTGRLDGSGLDNHGAGSTAFDFALARAPARFFSIRAATSGDNAGGPVSGVAFACPDPWLSAGAPAAMALASALAVAPASTVALFPASPVAGGGGDGAPDALALASGSVVVPAGLSVWSAGWPAGGATVEDSVGSADGAAVADGACSGICKLLRRLACWRRHCRGCCCCCCCFSSLVW